MGRTSAKKTPPNVWLAGFVAWLIPGGGHWLLGMSRRGVVLFAAIVSTFALGVLLGGIEVVGPGLSKFGFFCQLLSGLPGLVTSLLQNPHVEAGFGRAVDYGLIYTGIAGGLNLLCILDVVTRRLEACDQTHRQGKERSR